MRHIISRPLALVACAGLATVLAACGRDDTKTESDSVSTPPSAVHQQTDGQMPSGCGARGAVVLALAGHANAPAPRMSAVMSSVVDEAIESRAAIGLVSVEGRPRLVDAGVFSSDAENPSAEEEDKTAFRSSLLHTVETVRAASPHVDGLQSLRFAADTVRSACASRGTIVLQDSGLPDAGALNFAASDLLGADPAEVAIFLRRHSALPDLRGITVFLDVGNTAPPQQPLPVAARHNVTAIWRAVISASGARSVLLDPSPLAGDAPEVTHPVTPIRVPANPVYRVSKSAPTSFSLPDSGPVGFQPNRASFRDPGAATAALRRFASELTNLPVGARVILTGTTSSAGGSSRAAEAGRARLSTARAARVRDVLVAAGFPADHVVVRGVGIDFDGYVTDTDERGNLLPGPAQHNRSVQVTVLPL